MPPDTYVWAVVGPKGAVYPRASGDTPDWAWSRMRSHRGRQWFCSAGVQSHRAFVREATRRGYRCKKYRLVEVE